MGLWLFLIFVGLPIVEIALFIKVGGAIGLLPTLGIVVLTRGRGRRDHALAGPAARSTDCGRRCRRAGIRSGRLAHGALILVAGILLILPGFFTDTLGLLLLVPPVRTQLIRWGASGVTVRAAGVCPAGACAAGRGSRSTRSTRCSTTRAWTAGGGGLGVDAAVSLSVRCGSARAAC